MLNLPPLRSGANLNPASQRGSFFLRGGVGRSREDIAAARFGTEKTLEPLPPELVLCRALQAALLMVCRCSRILWRAEPRRQRAYRGLPLFAL